MISIIIPTFNRGYIVTRAIDSALSQTHRDFEIIVVDDGSTDNTREVLEPYKDRIRYFYQENKGVARARNKGIQEAKGEYIAFLDSDDYWLPEKLELQTEFLRSHPDVSMVYSRHWKELDRGKKKLRPKWKRLAQGHIYNKLLFSSHIWMGSVLVRKDCVHQVGLIDNRLDKDFFLKIARNFKVGAIDRPLAVHNQTNKVSKGMKGPLERENVYKSGFEELRTWDKICYFLVFRLKCSRHFASAGKKYLQERNYRTSIRYYYEALKRYPFRFKYWKGLFKGLKNVVSMEFNFESH